MYYRTRNPNLRFLASMHALPASSPTLPQWAVDAYDWAECLVFESEIGPEALSCFIAQDGISLEQKVSAELYAPLRQVWASNPKLPELSTLRPWAAAMLAGAAVSPMVAGIEPTFIQWAIENGKEVQYLESPSSFAALADGIPLSLVEHTLSRMLADAESVRHKQLAMHAAWIQCDMHAFERIAEALPLLEFPLIKSAILDLRSKAWARDLQKRVENTTKKTLVAVGALHLCISPTAQQSAQINLEPVNCV